jgi:hypothetical protein
MHHRRNQMNANPADYLAAAKSALGNGAMSDRELGVKLGGYAQSTIATAKHGNMSDPLALRVAEVIAIDPGELLMVARLAREKDPAVKAALSAWASKTLAALPLNTALVERGGMAAAERPRRVARVASVALVVSALAGGAPAPAEARPALSAGNGQTMCIMSNRRRAANGEKFTQAA